MSQNAASVLNKENDYLYPDSTVCQFIQDQRTLIVCTLKQLV